LLLSSFTLRSLYASSNLPSYPLSCLPLSFFQKALSNSKPPNTTGSCHIAEGNNVANKLPLRLPYRTPHSSYQSLGNLAKPLASLSTRLASVIWPNRAADPVNENIIERSYPFLDHVWTGPQAECWYLESLAVHPDYQDEGNGRALVQWGLDQAAREGVCASVIGADGKERFYQRCGFDREYGRSGQGEGNPLADVPGGIIFFRDVKD
jgi:GNAT superfamily N-acetyltransferase